MINQVIEELKAHLGEENRGNHYNTRVIDLKTFVHFISADNEVKKLLMKYGIQDADVFRQALLNEIIDGNRAQNNNNQGNNQQRNRNNVAVERRPVPNDANRNFFQNRYGQAPNPVNGNEQAQNEEENNVPEVELNQEFKDVYRQAQIIEYRLQNEEENVNQNQAGDAEIQENELDGIDPTFDSLLRAMPIYNQIYRRTPPIVVTLQQHGFNWQDFLERKDALEDFCVNLNEMARDGKIDKVIGREDEILLAAQVLGKKKKANPVFLGKAGVGKTAIAEGLAYKIVHEMEEGGVPHTLSNAVVYSLNTNDLVAGASFRGEFEARIKEVLSELKKKAKEDEILPILFIDELHSIIGTGGQQGTNDMASALKKVLSGGEIACMGATTTGEWNKHIKNDHALRRRFHPIKVEEPSRQETIDILLGAKEYFEKKHELEFTDEAIVRCVDLSIKHINETALPDKAIDLMDFCGSMYRILREEEVESEHMEQALSRYKKIPLERIVQNIEEESDYVSLSPKVKNMVYGQDKVVDEICEVVEVSQAGMGEANKPIASFLLTGPTGVGKTETAKQLAEAMGLPFERIDMSEMKESHSVSKLIGTSAGYVGYGETPLLTKILSKNAHCVLLLDEMEKAHPDIQNIFLQAMDNGMIRDGQHEELSFENVVLLMTSNAGAREFQAGSIGFGNSEEETSASLSRSNRAINNYFTPEFRGRLDGVVRFNSLSREVMPMILEKRIKVVNQKEGLLTKKLKVELTKKAKDYFSEKGYSPKLGARPLEHLVKRELEKMLTRELLYGKLKGVKDKKVKVTLKDGKCVISRIS